MNIEMYRVDSNIEMYRFYRNIEMYTRRTHARTHARTRMYVVKLTCDLSLHTCVSFFMKYVLYHYTFDFLLTVKESPISNIGVDSIPMTGI